MNPRVQSGEIELWARARDGDAEARERLAELTRELADSELRRRGVARAELEDLTQEVLRSTFAYLARQAEDPKDLRAFLKFRAWGVLSDHRKRKRTHVPIADTESVPDVASEEIGPEGGARLRQMLAALSDCTARLNQEQRIVVELRYATRLETEDIAARLTVHRNTVNVRVFRALEKLRECMGRKGFEPGDLSA
jgi:RNA polymerase sigma-70 factor (ECF subfamily)